MTLTEFNTQVVPLINLFFSAAGLVSVILLIIQIMQSNKWNRLQSKFNFIDVANPTENARELNKMFEKLGLHDLPSEQKNPLGAEAIKKIEANGHDSTFIVDMFCNDMQNMCASLRYGLVDKKVFSAIHSGRICWWWRELSSYVEKKRIDYDDPNLWADFEHVAKEFIHIRN